MILPRVSAATYLPVFIFSHVLFHIRGISHLLEENGKSRPDVAFAGNLDVKPVIFAPPFSRSTVRFRSTSDCAVAALGV